MTSRRDLISHWVEDVFPPTFGLTARELHERDFPPETEDNKISAENDKEKLKASVFEKVARRISPLDASDIKNVYERVWLMTLLEEEELKKKIATDSSGTFENLKSSAEPKLGKKDGDLKVTAGTDDPLVVDIEDNNLWDSNEISILRRVFKETRRQNTQLKAMLKANQEQLRKLERKFKRQCNTLEMRTEKLQEAKKVTERYRIASDSLKQQFKGANKTVDFLHEEIKNLRGTQSKLTKENQHLKLELDKERIDRKNTQFDLINQQQSALRDMELREEKLKLLQAEDIEFLQNEIEALTKELEKEKSDHQRSLKGLQHLRNHFSSIPLVANTVKFDSKANVVDCDQLQKWTV